MTFGDRFYSVAELADVTGYHRDSIYRAIESGSLAAAKPRGKWLIAGASINAWLDDARPAAQHATTHTTTAPRPRRPPRQAASRARPSFRELARRRRTE